MVGAETVDRDKISRQISSLFTRHDIPVTMLTGLNAGKRITGKDGVHVWKWPVSDDVTAKVQFQTLGFLRKEVPVSACITRKMLSRGGLEFQVEVHSHQNEEGPTIVVSGVKKPGSDPLIEQRPWLVVSSLDNKIAATRSRKPLVRLKTALPQIFDADSGQIIPDVAILVDILTPIVFNEGSQE